MKKLLGILLLSLFAAMPVLASETMSRDANNKAATASPLGDKSANKKMPSKNDCDGMNGMHEYHRGAMMGGEGLDMMLKPDMHILAKLGISEVQQSKINKLADELMHNNWVTQGAMNDETAKLRDLYETDKRDPAAIGAEYQKIFDLKRQMIETYWTAQNGIEEVLTAEQLAKLKNFRHEMHGNYMK